MRVIYFLLHTRVSRFFSNLIHFKILFPSKLRSSAITVEEFQSPSRSTQSKVRLSSGIDAKNDNISKTAVQAACSTSNERFFSARSLELSIDDPRQDAASRCASWTLTVHGHETGKLSRAPSQRRRRGEWSAGFRGLVLRPASFSSPIM